MSGRFEKEVISNEKMQIKLQTLPEIFAEFYYHMYSNKSYTTVEKYIAYVQEFAMFVGKGKIKKDFYINVAPMNINRYFAQMRNKEYGGKYTRTSDSIRATKWSALNTFFVFLKNNDYIKENPMEKTVRPRVQDNPSVSYLNENEIRLMLDNVNKIAKEQVKNRDLAILMLGLSTGLRVSAIVQINVQDIDFENNIIRVIEKRGKVCDVLIGEKLKQQLLLWMQDRKKYFFDASTDALFISNFRKRISKDRVASMLEKYSKGITDKHVTPHVMRHSCATNLYEKTGDIYLCAEVLHHKNIATTKRYAEMSQEKKKKATDILNNML